LFSRQAVQPETTLTWVNISLTVTAVAIPTAANQLLHCRGDQPFAFQSLLGTNAGGRPFDGLNPGGQMFPQPGQGMMRGYQGYGGGCPSLSSSRAVDSSSGSSSSTLSTRGA
jgi:hypothetical protein